MRPMAPGLLRLSRRADMLASALEQLAIRARSNVLGAQRCCGLGALPSPLRGGVGGGGREMEAPASPNSPPPTPALPPRKSGMPNLATIVRNPGKPGLRGG